MEGWNFNKLKPFVTIKIIIGQDNSTNLKDEDVKFLEKDLMKKM